MSQKIKVSILGVTGYTGLELLRMLVNHPHVELKHLLSVTNKDVKISELWPHLRGVCDLPLSDVPLAQAAKESDVLFLALPHLETQKIIPGIIGGAASKAKIIDLSGDFRLKNTGMYTKYYGHHHEYPQGIDQFVYGLPEISSAAIKKAHNVANPGCFAITAQLALLPLKNSIEHVSIMAVTGSSGSGKQPKDETHHPVRSHNLSSYKIGAHQHIPEIIQTLEMSESQLTMVPTSGPFVRGIHLTAFVDLKSTAQRFDEAQLVELYEKTYAEQPFVRLKKKVQLAEVVGSNFCDISVHLVNGKIVVQAVIDNLVKGAAGNAVQNMNLMCGFDETTGLATMSPLFP